MKARFQVAMCALFASVAVLATSQPAAAAPVTYTEKIEDVSVLFTILDFLDIERDLTRTRTLGDGTVDMETDDATIVADHTLSANWGYSTAEGFSWSHQFFFEPPAGEFIEARLILDVVGVHGDLPDFVFVEGFPVGVLTHGGFDVQSTTLLTTLGFPDPDALISFVVSDGRVDVGVLPVLFDFMTIRASTVEVIYEPTAVPEPTTAVLLMSGAAVGMWRRSRRNRSQRNDATRLV
jgi:hypothetical protein